MNSKTQKNVKVELSPEEIQKEKFTKAMKDANKHGYHMKLAADKKQFQKMLDAACLMLGELRTAELTPSNYYELYLSIRSKLGFLEHYFQELHEVDGWSCKDLYKRVQYVGEIVPRLYLMITVAQIYISSQEGNATDIIDDLVEMCKGVQHPTRGLFLRLYMTQRTKDKLPDVGSKYGTEFERSIKYLLENFKDTINLYCRLKNDWKGKKREQERKQLRTLLGFNLERLSYLQGVSVDIYQTRVLPEILKIILNYKDPMSQEYLLQCIVGVFPDEYHIATLDRFLEACTQVHPNVDVKVIYIALMDRLKLFAKNFPDKLPERNIVQVFTDFIQKNTSTNLEDLDFLLIQTSLLGLSLSIYKNNIDIVNEILSSVKSRLSETESIGEDVSNQLQLMIEDVVFPSFDSLLTGLKLPDLPGILKLLNFERRSSLAMFFIDTALEQQVIIDHWDPIIAFMALVDPLIKDQDDQVKEISEETFKHQQKQIARITHLCRSDDTDVLFRIYGTIRKYFGQGGFKRIRYTLLPLLFAYLELASKIQAEESKSENKKKFPKEKVFDFCVQTLDVLAKEHKELTLELYIQSAMCADSSDCPTYSYDMLSKAFLLYEELDSKVQLNFLSKLINAVGNLKNSDVENYSTLSTRACQNSAKLLFKPDQCRAAFLCSQLFWPVNSFPAARNSAKALECLQWSLKIVRSCMSDQQLSLFVEILNIYLYQFDYNNDKVTVNYINGLIDLIDTDLDSNEGGGDDGVFEDKAKKAEVEKVKTYYLRTQEYIRSMKENPRYSGIKS